MCIQPHRLQEFSVFLPAISSSLPLRKMLISLFFANARLITRFAFFYTTYNNLEAFLSDLNLLFVRENFQFFTVDGVCAFVIWGAFDRRKGHGKLGE